MRFALMLGLALLFSIQFTLVHFSSMAINPAADLDRLLASTADTPFQYRALIPWLVRIIRFGLADVGIEVDARYLFALSEVAALLAAQAALFRMIEATSADRQRATFWSFSLFFALAYVYLTPEYLRLWYASDLPAVAFFGWGLIALRKRRWTLFCTLFVLGTFNRETTIFLALAAFLVEWSGPGKAHALARFCALAAVWIAIKLYLFWLYGGNPGAGLFATDKLSNNLAILPDWRVLVRLTSLAGFTWIAPLVLYRRIEDRDLARALWIVPPYLLAMMLVANLDELRVYGELVPLLLPASLLALGALGPRSAA